MSSNTLDYHKTHPSLPWPVAEQLQLQMQTLWAVEAIRGRLEAQQETPASGLTLHESAGASPKTGTTSTLATGTTGPTSSRLGLGRAWEESGSLLTRNLPSRTTEPTSSTPSTGRSTGPSAHSAEFVDSLSHRDRFMFDAGRSYEAELRGDKGTPWAEVKAQLFPDSPASSPEPAQGGSDVEAILGYLRDKFVRKFGASASTATQCNECGKRLGEHMYADCPSDPLTNHEGRE